MLTAGQEFAIRDEIHIESVVHLQSTGEQAAARKARIVTGYSYFPAYFNIIPVMDVTQSV
jgi:hypothetical protein